MGFKIGELLGHFQVEEPKPGKVVRKRYYLELDYVRDRQQNPIYSRICKVKIRGLSEPFDLEEEVRPYSRRDNLSADASYWDKPLFKVFLS